MISPAVLNQARCARRSLSFSLDFRMPSYLIKPREPTVLSHKEYHELSSTNLLLSTAVSPRPPLPNITLRRYTNPRSCATGLHRPHNSRDLGHRKVQPRIGRGIVELSAPCGETSETKYARRTLDGPP